MSASYVKGTVIQSATGNNCSGPVTSTAGNALICGGSSDNPTPTNPTITGGGIATWTKDASGSYNGAGAAASISSGPSSSGGTNTLTATASGTSGATAIVHEWSGLPSSGTLSDAASPAIKTGSATPASTNSLTNVSANAVFVAWVSDITGANPATVTSTGSGWTLPSDAVNTNGTTGDACGLAYKIVSSVAAQSESWTIDSTQWGALIAVYKQAASGFTWQQLTSYPDQVAEKFAQAIPY